MCRGYPVFSGTIKNSDDKAWVEKFDVIAQGVRLYILEGAIGEVICAPE